MAGLKGIKAKMRKWYGNLSVKALATNEELKNSIALFELELEKCERHAKRPDTSNLFAAIENCFRAAGTIRREQISLNGLTLNAGGSNAL